MAQTRKRSDGVVERWSSGAGALDLYRMFASVSLRCNVWQNGLALQSSTTPSLRVFLLERIYET
jgi:hypothetical protein